MTYIAVVKLLACEELEPADGGPTKDLSCSFRPLLMQRLRRTSSPEPVICRRVSSTVGKPISARGTAAAVAGINSHHQVPYKYTSRRCGTSLKHMHADSRASRLF